MKDSNAHKRPKGWKNKESGLTKQEEASCPGTKYLFFAGDSCGVIKEDMKEEEDLNKYEI